MRISDWSSDVCSSDQRVIRKRNGGKAAVVAARVLHGPGGLAVPDHVVKEGPVEGMPGCVRKHGDAVPGTPQSQASEQQSQGNRRSEERRVGKEGVRTGRSRWSP